MDLSAFIQSYWYQQAPKQLSVFQRHVVQFLIQLDYSYRLPAGTSGGHVIQ